MRDRLIELMEQSIECCEDETAVDCANCKYCGTEGARYCSIEKCADYLLANDVIVPPCKVGDKIYKLCSVNSMIKMGQMWDGNIVKTNCDRCGYRNCSCYDIGIRELNNPNFINVIEEKTAYSLEFIVRIMPYFGTIWFASKEEAEKALKEREE